MILINNIGYVLYIISKNWNTFVDRNVVSNVGKNNLTVLASVKVKIRTVGFVANGEEILEWKNEVAFEYERDYGGGAD